MYSTIVFCTMIISSCDCLVLNNIGLILLAIVDIFWELSCLGLRFGM